MLSLAALRRRRRRFTKVSILAGRASCARSRLSTGGSPLAAGSQLSRGFGCANGADTPSRKAAQRPEAGLASRAPAADRPAASGQRRPAAATSLQRARNSDRRALDGQGALFNLHAAKCRGRKRPAVTRRDETRR